MKPRHWDLWIGVIHSNRIHVTIAYDFDWLPIPSQAARRKRSSFVTTELLGKNIFPAYPKKVLLHIEIPIDTLRENNNTILFIINTIKSLLFIATKNLK